MIASSNFIAAFVSFTISSVTPEVASLNESAAPAKSPERNLPTASPSPDILSINTLTVAPIPAIALLTISAPFCVFVKNTTTEPKATTSAPIPVLIKATFKNFIAFVNPLEAIAAAFWLNVIFLFAAVCIVVDAVNFLCSKSLVRCVTDNFFSTASASLLASADAFCAALKLFIDSFMSPKLPMTDSIC